MTLDTYPAESSRFLKQEKDRFANPVRYTTSQEMEALYDELLHGLNPDRLFASLDNIIKIRAVQDFSPSQAIAFAFLLKKAIREELKGEIQENQLFDELLKFESRIDKLALLALDVYTQRRDKVQELRVNEVKAQKEMIFKVLERTNQMLEKLDIKDGTT